MKLTVITVMLFIALLRMLNVKSVLAQSNPTPTSENKPPECSNIVQTNSGVRWSARARVRRDSRLRRPHADTWRYISSD
jgi:NADH:ubiquinone oxidoreductase subunit 3 (subunit A)